MIFYKQYNSRVIPHHNWFTILFCPGARGALGGGSPAQEVHGAAGPAVRLRQALGPHQLLRPEAAAGPADSPGGAARRPQEGAGGV